MRMARNYSAAAALCLAVSSTSWDVGHGLVIGRSRQPFIARRKRRTPTRSSMGMYIDDPTAMVSFDIPGLSASMPPSHAHKLLASDSKLEIELLNDASHVALDVSTFLGPNTALLRLCNVVGRICIISSDLIQADSVSPDEWVFQASMLAVATRMFFQSAWPLLLAIFSISALSVRERRIYALLFEAVGLSILQYKTLLASSTLAWDEYEPDARVELNGEHMYFLYKGEAAIPDAVPLVDQYPSSAGNPEISEGQHVGTRFFGDVQFAKALESSSVYKKTKKNSKSGKKEDAAPTTSNETVVVGSNGASMLRISTSKLLKLMKNDEELSASIQRLVLLCLQEKLSRTPKEGGLRTSNATYAAPATV